MKQLTRLLLLSMLLCVLPSGSSAQKSRSRTRKTSPPPVVCNLESVPQGMVVVGYKRNAACSNGTELVVKRPENGDIVCAESPVPATFSVTTEAQGNAVGTCPNRAFLISGGNADRATRRGRASLDDAIARAFANRASDIQVEGEGTVIRVLADDTKGSRHQRFIVELASGQTLLISHNIDIAPRIKGLEEGDRVRFNGEYVWNAKGGVIHWTHRDPKSRHVAGWVIHNGTKYQ